MSSLSPPCSLVLSCVSFTATATTEVYTLSLHDALPILWQAGPLRATEEGFSVGGALALRTVLIGVLAIGFLSSTDGRSEEHTSELQSRGHLVCRLLLEKKKNENNETTALTASKGTNVVR